jgi:hypothetical protein
MSKLPLAADWHRANRMPKNPTLDQRLDWHVAHAKVCGCREMPDSIRAAIAGRTRGGRRDTR